MGRDCTPDLKPLSGSGRERESWSSLWPPVGGEDHGASLGIRWGREILAGAWLGLPAGASNLVPVSEAIGGEFRPSRNSGPRPRSLREGKRRVGKGGHSAHLRLPKGNVANFKRGAKRVASSSVRRRLRYRNVRADVPHVLQKDSGDGEVVGQSWPHGRLGSLSCARGRGSR